MSNLVINTDDLLNSILHKSQNAREKSYEDASEECIKMVVAAINTYPEFDHVKAAKIKYLFKLGNWAKIGECSKASGKWRHLTDFDYVIMFHKDSWEVFTLEQRQALIHHELSHISRNNEKWGIAVHDVEEFLSTFKRFGAWSGSLQMVEQIFKEKQLKE